LRPHHSASHFNLAEKAVIALGLLGLSLLLYGVNFWLFGDLDLMRKYFMLHLAFLPVHALVLTVILEELLNFRERISRLRRLDTYLGVFFRRMGIDLYLRLVVLLDNREELEDIILVQPGWNHRDFRNAHRRLARFQPRMRPDPQGMRALLDFLVANDNEILEMTRNPYLWEYDNFYRMVVAFFHFLEQTRFRDEPALASPWLLGHLAEEAGRTLLMLMHIWLGYLEQLKKDHPALFRSQLGVHNTVIPILLDEEWEERP
jgi:hypothetical protein